MTHPGPAVPPRPTPVPFGTTSLASPASQGLAALAIIVVFGALASRVGDPTWFAAPTIALLVGVVLGVGADLRRAFGAVPGLLLALLAFIVLSVLWAVLMARAGSAFPYAVAPLAAIGVFGADWWWADRLRPITVTSGIALVLVLEPDLGAALPLALGWFAVAAAALWSLRLDVQRALPTPTPLAGAAGPVADEGRAVRAIAGFVASWAIAAAVVALVGLLLFRPDVPEGRVVGSGAGSSSGAGAGSGRSGAEPMPWGIDRDGDGIPDDIAPGRVDVDGDGIPDQVGGGSATTPRSGSGDPSSGAPPDGPGAASPTSDRDVAGTAARVALWVGGALIVAALIALAIRAVGRARARRRARAARPWAVLAAERLEREGARRGRPRRPAEPVTRYAAALASEVLVHDDLAAAGVTLSAALFGPGPAPDTDRSWVTGVVDEAVADNPSPRWWDGIGARGRRR